LEYREGLLNYCRDHKVPLDFYSWHTYAFQSGDPYDAARLANHFRSLLDSNGFSKAESILSEWNLTPDFTDSEKANLQGSHNAAFVGAALTYMQDAPVDRAIFYRGDATWMGLFDLKGNYFTPAYTFKAMGQMLDTPAKLSVKGTDTYGFAALAGKSADGREVQILISNYAIPADFKPGNLHMTPDVLKAFSKIMAEYAQKSNDPSYVNELPRRMDVVYKDNAGYNLEVSNLPWGKGSFTMKRYRISRTQNLDEVEDKSLSGKSLALSVEMPVDTVDLIVLKLK
jgi:hypothetical protein